MDTTMSTTLDHPDSSGSRSPSPASPLRLWLGVPALVFLERLSFYALLSSLVAFAAAAPAEGGLGLSRLRATELHDLTRWLVPLTFLLGGALAYLWRLRGNVLAGPLLMLAGAGALAFTPAGLVPVLPIGLFLLGDACLRTGAYAYAGRRLLTRPAETRAAASLRPSLALFFAIGLAVTAGAALGPKLASLGSSFLGQRSGPLVITGLTLLTFLPLLPLLTLPARSPRSASGSPADSPFAGRNVSSALLLGPPVALFGIAYLLHAATLRPAPPGVDVDVYAWMGSFMLVLGIALGTLGVVLLAVFEATGRTSPDPVKTAAAGLALGAAGLALDAPLVAGYGPAALPVVTFQELAFVVADLLLVGAWARVALGGGRAAALATGVMLALTTLVSPLYALLAPRLAPPTPGRSALLALAVGVLALGLWWLAGSLEVRTRTAAPAAPQEPPGPPAEGEDGEDEGAQVSAPGLGGDDDGPQDEGR